jgi:glycosyltransferase involved in cell wall biosynthesis
VNPRSDVTVVIPMYRSGALTASVVTALQRCIVPEGASLHIIVVDDASGDASGDVIKGLGHANVTLITSMLNGGRSAARNRGAAAAADSRILFLDSDCVPIGPNFLLAHLATLDRGVDVSMGAVEGAGDGFWHDYQAAAAKRRHLASRRDGVALHGASPNFMIPRSLFLSVGGFDEGYKGYGFEDRDFFLRLEKAGFFAEWSADAKVIHQDALCLRTVCTKMAIAGGAPALRFRERHPEAYKLLGYGKLDARNHVFLRLVEPIISWITRLLLPWLDPRLNGGPLPLSWRISLVRLLVAVSYVHGTVHPKPSAATDP